MGKRGKISQKLIKKTGIGTPAKPSHLSAETAKVWDELVARLDGEKVLVLNDAAALEVLAETLASYRRSVAAIAAQGEVVVLPNGIQALNPWAKIRKSSGDFLQKMLSEFGLTPAARSRVVPADDPSEVNPIDEFLLNPSPIARIGG
jgi:P27 family predicted phage terminase small subunit